MKLKRNNIKAIGPNDGSKNGEDLFIFNYMVEGDKGAFRFFFEKYYTELCDFVNLYVHNPEMSEEIAQDIFVWFWEKRNTIQIVTSVKSYLLKAGKNKGLNYLRNEKGKLKIHEKLARANSFEESPEKIMDAVKLRILIEDSINSLPNKCREIFIMAKEKDFSYKEIAVRMGISVKTVENQMGTALKKLREMLLPHYNELFILLILTVCCI